MTRQIMAGSSKPQYLFCGLTIIIIGVFYILNCKVPTVQSTTKVQTGNGNLRTEDATKEYSCKEEYIRSKIDQSESAWKDGVILRKKMAAERPEIFKDPWNGKSGLIVWDYFQPVFNCPHLVERIGHVGDGGKWVCGVSHLAQRAKSCLVYSYGVSNDVSFEQELLNRTNCTLRSFDPTVDPWNVKLPKYNPARSSFAKIGLGMEDSTIFRTLKSEMNLHGDKFIDILKVDIEGHEFDSFRKILKDFPESLPFGQLLVEIHLHNFTEKDLFAQFALWWDVMENSGLRSFNREINSYKLYYGAKNPLYYEYSFLNVKTDHIVLHA